MGGGVMQLVAVGSQDQYISGSPEISYFKMVYKRHTNFSMESVRQSFNTKPTLDLNGNTFTCRISRVADLLQEIFFSVELPDIYSSEKFRFRWIPNIACYMINSCSVRIDTQLIDQTWGEWMDIWNELTLTSDKREGYNKLTGNIEEFVNPRIQEPIVVLDNNTISYIYYPEGITEPSIKKRRLYLPLPFWFTKNPGLALPLIALQYQNIDVTIELRSIEELYQIYYKDEDRFISPKEYRTKRPQLGDRKIFLNTDEQYENVINEDVNIERFTVPLGQSYVNKTSSIDIDAYLECNYIFLDESERRSIAINSHDYLIERVHRIEREGLTTQGTIDMILQNPVKEILWIARRSDVSKTNDWSDFTDNSKTILKSGKMLWNGMDRFEDKTPEYFNGLQPFQYHTRCPRDGIYVYSFALYPEKSQPSGSFNASTINKIQMYVTTNPPTDNQYDYEFVFYALYYNIFRVMAGSGGMVFAN